VNRPVSAAGGGDPEVKWDFLLLLLSSLTILSAVFLVWELIELKFFSSLDVTTMHFLYITRGMSSGILMAAWAAWFTLRQRRAYESKQAQIHSQLLQAEKLSALGELVSGLAHEINNPVGIMSSHLELMMKDPALLGAPPALARDVEVLRRNTARIADLTRNLLNFARNSPSEFVPVRMESAAGNVFRLMEDLIKNRGIRLVKKFDAGLPFSGNQNQLEQVVLNLLKNAVEAVESVPDPMIEVSAWYKPETRRVCLHVRDNGVGLPSWGADKIFDPFFTTKEKGTGLGLSVSYGIVRGHGGELLAAGEGTPDGRGACFLVSLPALAAEKKAGIPAGRKAAQHA
jgi:two-component system, NtrC family, sensor kinase